MHLAQIQDRQNQFNADSYGTGVSEWQQYKVSVRYYTRKMCYVPAFLLLQGIKEMISFLSVNIWLAYCRRKSELLQEVLKI